jgi:hypothetical protein
MVSELQALKLSKFGRILLVCTKLIVADTNVIIKGVYLELAWIAIVCPCILAMQNCYRIKN